MSSNGKSQWMLDRLGRFLTGPDQPQQHSSNTPGLGGPIEAAEQPSAHPPLDPEEGVGPVRPFDASSLLRASEQWKPPTEAEEDVVDDTPAEDTPSWMPVDRAVDGGLDDSIDQDESAEDAEPEAGPEPAAEPMLEPQATISGETLLIPPANLTFDPASESEPADASDPEREPITSPATPLMSDTEFEPASGDLDASDDFDGRDVQDVQDDEVEAHDEVVEVVVPVMRDGVAVVEPLLPPETDEELEAALTRDLGADMAWLDDERFDLYPDPDVIAADEATDQVLEAIARADAEAMRSDADLEADAPEAPEAPHTPALLQPDDSPETEAPGAATSQEDQGLDAAIESLRVVPVSGPGLDLLPAEVITTEVTPTITGAVATVAPGSVDFVTEDRCASWDITAGMAVSVAETNTRELGDVTAEVVEVHGVQVTVVESSLPIAVSALQWLEDHVESPLPVGSLVFAPSPHLLVIQATAARAPHASETLMNFTRAESNPPHSLMGPVLFQQTIDGLEVVSELGTAAGRLAAIVATS